MAEEKEKAVTTEETTEAVTIIDEIVQATKLQPADEAYAKTKKGLEVFISQLLEPDRVVDQVTRAVVDEMIAEIDNKMSLQLDAILHHPDLQKVESAWRSLKFMVDNTDFRENIKIEIRTLIILLLSSSR